MALYIDEPFKKYIDDLSAKLPAPGGGSAAAATAAFGASLIAMVLHYTIGKEKYKKYERKLSECLEQVKDIKHRLCQLIDDDVEVYKKVSETFKSHDGTIKEKSLKDAAGVPIEICTCCHKALRICREVMDKTNANLLSDIGVAAELLAASYNSALFNVFINTKSIKDKNFTGPIEEAIEPQKKEVEEIKQTILDFVHTTLTF